MSNVNINIAAEFVGKKAFKQADTATEKLTKNVKNLGKTFGVAFGTTALLSYSKQAVKAAAEDQAAQASLAQTLKNLGFESVGTANSLNDYISTLERATGKLDDELRPAMDRLLRATGSVTKSQDLMNLALDISAGTGKNLGQVTQSLQKAYLGQTQALGRLGVGLSRAELTSSSFEQIQSRLTDLFAGQGKRAADSYEGSMNKLAVATNNVKENIGVGIIDALTSLSSDTSIESLTTEMENLSIYIADVVRGIGNLGSGLKSIPGFGGAGVQDLIQAIPIIGSYINLLAKSGESTRKINMADQKFGGIYATKYQQEANLAAEKLATAYAKEQARLAKLKLDAERKSLAAKRLSNAIDKANLALGKGSEIFDMDKIQIAAALTNQAEQLGKATNGAQILQITNDTARLNVKKSINELEDAIASKDEAAIKRATARLDEDVKILGVLTNQDLKMQDIESILESLKPKDLINISNLEEALRLLREINLTPTGSTKAITSAAATGTGMPLLTDKEVNEALAAGSFVPIVAGTGGVVGGSTAAGAYAPTGFPAAGGTTKIELTVVAPPFTDPNAVAEAIDDYVRGAVDRGTLRAR
jgi:hypothetical protein